MDYKNIARQLGKIIDEFFSAKEDLLEAVITQTVKRLKEGGKIIVFGNGGSAAQAQHFAAEIVNKFLKERPAYPALSLTTDTSALTSIANDISFAQVFSRQLEALASQKDVALGISTSGNSLNVIEGLKKAKKMKMLTIALTGEGGGRLAFLPDYLLDVPSSTTPRVQEVHLLFLHFLAEEIEKRMT
ncbi:MAG: SIS domain-containing protein [Candidatus Aminicenantales bacterium]